MNGMPNATALLFPGQGSHSEGMHEPFEDHPLLRRGIELLGFDPFASLAAGTGSQQPALFLCSMAQWASRGDGEPDPLAAAGHSLGEYAALDRRRRDRLRRRRAPRRRSRAGDGRRRRQQPGGMVAMLGGEARARRRARPGARLSLANDNAPGQIVLSGSIVDVDGPSAARRRSAAASASSPSLVRSTRRSWRPPPTGSRGRSPRRRSASRRSPSSPTEHPPLRGHPR